MTVLFQEEVSKLRLQIVELSEQNAALERDKQRLAGLLTEEKQQTQELAADLVQKAADLRDTKELLAEKTRQNERLADADERASEATARAATLDAENDQLALDAAKIATDLTHAKNDLARVTARLVEADKQIEPLRVLVAALKVQKDTQTVIFAQLELLDLASTD